MSLAEIPDIENGTEVPHSIFVVEIVKVICVPSFTAAALEEI